MNIYYKCIKHNINRDEETNEPRHRGLGEESTSFFRKGARSNPAANSPKKGIKIGKKRIGNVTGTPARERPLTRMRARSKNWTYPIGLDLKLVRCVKKRLDLKDVEARKIDMKHSKEEELQQETRPVGACFIERYQAAVHKGEMERKKNFGYLLTVLRCGLRVTTAPENPTTEKFWRKPTCQKSSLEFRLSFWLLTTLVKISTQPWWLGGRVLV